MMKLFKLIEHRILVPMIGSGKICYQMVAVQDCADAIYQAVRHQPPNKAYNLGSENPPTVRDLLKQVIVSSHFKSFLVPTWARAARRTLDVLGIIGVENMYKEQHMIATENYPIDISETKEEMSWSPQYNDADRMMEASREYR